MNIVIADNNNNDDLKNLIIMMMMIKRIKTFIILVKPIDVFFFQ